MKRSLHPALVWLLFPLLISCGIHRPSGAKLTRSEADSIAWTAAKHEDVPTHQFKMHHLRYLQDRKTWYATFEERGMLLAAGEEFTVLIDDRSGKARFLRATGERTWLTKQRLDQQLGKLPPAP